MPHAIAIILFLLTASCSALRVSEYKKIAHTIVEKARKGESSREVARLGRELIHKAKPIIGRIREKNPACRKVLDIILEKSLEMTRLDLASIERDYHQGAALPESEEDCYEAKELIVHPATVVILATGRYGPAERQQIVDEIEEVLAHIDML